jgi:hypothetical protein
MPPYASLCPIYISLAFFFCPLTLVCTFIFRLYFLFSIHLSSFCPLFVSHFPPPPSCHLLTIRKQIHLCHKTHCNLLCPQFSPSPTHTYLWTFEPSTSVCQPARWSPRAVPYRPAATPHQITASELSLHNYTSHNNF